ncbi:MAG: phospholipase D family protein [Bryobacterales bacterium]|nr:phospholipase D family protein [Bryobacterales bacterium]
MILRSDNVLNRFEELLGAHTRVDIATAWATDGKHLRILADAARSNGGMRIRAIVGTAGNATHPDALERLNRITAGDLMIIGKGRRLFHPKLYLFRRNKNGTAGSCAWIGSANFTRMGFGIHAKSNEEIIMEMGPGEEADALADWFRERWDPCAMDRSVTDVIRRYTEAWNRNPPPRAVRELVSGPISQRFELLADAYRLRTFGQYRQALEECEEMLRNEEWEVLDPRGRSYMKVISERRKLLFGKTPWSDLRSGLLTRLKGGKSGADSHWWGLLGRLDRTNWSAVRDRETEVRRILKRVRKADGGEFPDIAIAAMKKFMDPHNFPNVGPGTATLLLTLARPDRLVSVNGPSRAALASLSGVAGKKGTTLGTPENYGKLLQWLYKQHWYSGPQPTDEVSIPIWKFRAALVDAFVYNWPD